MDKVYVDFFRDLLKHKDKLCAYVDSLYEGKEYTESDLNEIFSVLKAENLINGLYADGRYYECMLTYKGKHYFDNEERPRLLELIDQADEIEHEFHPVGEGSNPCVYIISDVQRFQDWLQELQLELQLLSDRTGDTFLNETLSLVKRGIDGYEEKKNFAILKSKLMAISKRENYYFSNIGKETTKHAEAVKKPLIFISHSSKNKKQAELFVDMLTAIGFQLEKHIFCSSLVGYDIPVGEKIREYLKRLFLEYSPHVIFLLSPYYYESSFSLNEMGAAWVLGAQHTSILLPGFEQNEMKGVVKNDAVSIVLDHDEDEVKDKLNQLRDILIKEFNIEKTADSTWKEARDKFIKEVNSIPATPRKRVNNNDSAIINEDILFLLNKISENPNATLSKFSNLSDGHTFVVGIEPIAKEYPDRREYAKWEEVIENCVKSGYLKQTDKYTYTLTNAGYKILRK